MKTRIWIICIVLVVAALSGMGWYYWHTFPASTMLPDFMLYTENGDSAKAEYCYILYDGNKLKAQIGNYLREDLEKGNIPQEKTIREKTITLNEQQAQKILCLLNEVEKDRYSEVTGIHELTQLQLYFKEKFYRSHLTGIEEIYNTTYDYKSSLNPDLIKLNDYLVCLIPFFDDPDWGFFYRAYAE